MFLYTYMYIYIYVHIYVYIHMYTYMYMYTFIYINTFTHVYRYIDKCIHHQLGYAIGGRRDKTGQNMSVLTSGKVLFDEVSKFV
jgi:hypothetical protein